MASNGQFATECLSVGYMSCTQYTEEYRGGNFKLAIKAQLLTSVNLSPRNLVGWLLTHH
jgi:hypothetical protein